MNFSNALFMDPWRWVFEPVARTDGLISLTACLWSKRRGYVIVNLLGLL